MKPLIILEGRHFLSNIALYTIIIFQMNIFWGNWAIINWGGNKAAGQYMILILTSTIVQNDMKLGTPVTWKTRLLLPILILIYKRVYHNISSCFFRLFFLIFRQNLLGLLLDRKVSYQAGGVVIIVFNLWFF